jgi:hypothetical protein
MKKIQLLFMLLLLSAICIQGCKKDVTTTASTISDKILSANINGTVWNPDTVSAAITYNAASNTKVFTVVGTADSTRITMSITLANSTNTDTFPLNTYKVDSTTNVKLAYYRYQQTSAGTNDYVQVGVVEPSSGSVIVTSIDPTKNVITGTYSFTSKKVNLDSNGNYVSIEIAQILLGSFTNLPYTFVSN